LDASGTGWGLLAGSCEHGSEPWGSIKGGNFSISGVIFGFSRSTVVRDVSELVINLE